MKPTNYKGSEKTAEKIKAQIAEKWGTEEAEKYNPSVNCRTFKNWKEQGFQVKKGEKALKTFTIVEKKNKEGEVISTYPKNINLFYIKQVEEIK